MITNFRTDNSNTAQGNRPRDVQVKEIASHTWVFRSRTWEPLKFEVEYARERGTTANTYLIRGDYPALIDPPGASFTTLFLEALTEAIALQDIQFVIVQHVNPNRMATLTKLLPHLPDARIVCSKPAAIAVKQASPEWESRLVVVRSGDTLALGAESCLQFSCIPMPRWADAICTYDPQTQILFTDKLLGAHVCGDDLWDTQWKDLQADRHHYFDSLFASQAKQAESALSRIMDYPAKIYAPGHGPIIRYSLSRLTAEYGQWCQQQQRQSLKVMILYASAYGNTEIAAHAIAQGLIQEGIQVQTVNCETLDLDTLPYLLDECDGVMIGSPTLGGHAPVQIQTALGILLASSAKNKLVGVFGSYGWSGEALDLIEGKLKDAGFSFGFETLRIRFSPTTETLNTCQTSGAQFAKALQKHKKARGVSQLLVTAQVDRTAQAVGRVVGSLCVLTFQGTEGDKSIMTSWVSQASFTPPGIMMAIADHPDMEELLQPGTPFILNLLQEGRLLRRHFSREQVCDPTTLPALNICKSEQGGVILTDSVAYLDCKTQQRSKCGDRWLIYATVEQGELLDTTGQTAIYYRTSGRDA